MAQPRQITLSELQRLVRQTLDERFALPLWVTAEIAEIKVNYSGHCYLELVEKGGDNGVPTAQARAVIWRSNHARIAAQFEAATGERLAAGLQILARVVVSYHELYGFSLQIIDIDPAYTLGDMERQRQQTIARLQEEGVWEMNRQIEVPPALQRIAIISSAQAAGYRDFCKEIEKSPYRIRVTLFDAFMQGAAAEESITAALCAVAERMEEFDAVAVIRGGGSSSDLNCFNTYRLSTHVAQFPLPVITGIGHDKDVSVVDMVAYCALKTPTAVAGWLVERLDTLAATLETAALRLRDALRDRTHAAEMRLEQLAGELRLTAADRLVRERLRGEQRTQQLHDATRSLLAAERLRLAAAGEVIAAHDPARLMKLGFAVLHGRGGAITRAADAAPGEALRITLADGEIETTINEITIWHKKS